MSFYSYKNANSTQCPCTISGNEVLNGLNEKICIQVQRVYDSCLQQKQEFRTFTTAVSPLLDQTCRQSDRRLRGSRNP